MRLQFTVPQFRKMEDAPNSDRNNSEHSDDEDEGDDDSFIVPVVPNGFARTNFRIKAVRRQARNDPGNAAFLLSTVLCDVIKNTREREIQYLHSIVDLELEFNRLRSLERRVKGRGELIKRLERDFGNVSGIGTIQYVRLSKMSDRQNTHELSHVFSKYPFSIVSQLNCLHNSWMSLDHDVQQLKTLLGE